MNIGMSSPISNFLLQRFIPNCYHKITENVASQRKCQLDLAWPIYQFYTSRISVTTDQSEGLQI